jgi:SPOR domain/Carboxypeptidase regulatory-like domain
MRRTGSILLFLALVASAYAAEPAEEEIRLLEYRLDDLVLSDTVAGYAGPRNGTLLPLGATAELIGVAVTVDADRGTAQGFVLRESAAFRLDVAREKVTLAGKPLRFARELVRVHAGDIYVDSKLLGEWLPAEFAVDLFALRVQVRPREPLPLQTRLERERRVRHWRLRLAPEDPGYPRVGSGYRLFDTPAIDQSVRLSLGADALHGSYATYATGDLLYMESEAYASGDDEDPLDDWRLTLRRRDPAATLGGVLHATEIAAGHVIHPASTLLSTSTEAAPGVLLTNLPLYRATEFDRHTFRGNLPPGWDVELYRDGTLVDYRQAGADGQYAFEDVPVLFGMNVFRLVFYGPQGQRREEEHRFLLGDSLTRPGRLEYRLAANAAASDERRGSLFLSYGINRHLTATAEVATLPTPRGERRFAKGGLRMFRSALFAYADYAADDTGGSAYEAGLQTRILGVNVLASRTGVRDGFVSEALHILGDPIVTRDRLRLDTAIPLPGSPRLPVSAELERHQLESGAVRTVVQGRVSASYRGVSVSNRLIHTTVTAQPSQTETGLQFSRYIRRVGVRGEVLYGISAARLTTANITLERPIRAGYRLYGSVTRSFLDGRYLIDKSSGSFAAGLETRITPGGESLANLNLSAGLGRDPHLGAWLASARSRAGFGALSVRVFLDRNRDGVFGAADTPIEGVAFTIGGVERPERTGLDGVAHLGELSPHTAADIAIAAHTLQDPQWDPSAGGVRIMPRPGKTASIDLAVIETTEIEGTVTRFRANGKPEAAAGLAIELTDDAGKVAHKTKTSYDGYYVISKVRPGRYSLRAGKNSPVREITVRAGQPLIAGADLRIGTPTASPAAPQLAEVSEAPVRPARAGKQFVVQLGAFAVRANADALLRRIGSDRARIDHRGKLYFVEAGPFDTAASADAARAQFVRGGFTAIVRGP